MRYAFIGTTLVAAALLAAPAAASDHQAPFGADMPDPGIPGYTFPEPEDTILGWVNAPFDAAQVELHGWGLWAALTMPSGQSAFGLPDAPTYMTWISKQALVALSQGSDGGATLKSAAPAARSLPLGPITQLRKFGMDSTEAAPAPAPMATAPTAITPDTVTLEMVAYDPTSAAHILDNDLFDLDVLSRLYNDGKAEVPAFPITAVVIKPVYKVIQKADLIDGGLYAMPAWPGTPEVTPEIEAHGFPETVWPGCVYVDTANTGTSGATGTDPDCAKPTDEATYGLGDFVTLPVTKENVAQLKSDDLEVAPGDTLLLMAMHVSTREITEWTWQTYFWTPDAANPPLPSSAATAKAMPSQLSAPASHYAMSYTYRMVAPNQPVNGGESVGEPVIGYNPYLESGFNAKVFSESRPIVNPKTGEKWVGTVGVQTNCMTCHALAAVGCTKEDQTGYATNFYLSRDDKVFKNTLQTEFLWSIADVATAGGATLDCRK